MLILAAAFTGLRWGELIALRQADVDIEARTLLVTRRLAELDDGTFHLGPTKSAAGFRKVEHLHEHVSDDTETLVFKGERGGQLRRSNFRRAVKWSTAIQRAGLPAGFRFHDLRHTGNHLAAQAGASTRELMHRMGHGSMRAALIYQHATSERDQEIAARLSKLVQRRHRPSNDGDEDDGAAGALVPAG